MPVLSANLSTEATCSLAKSVPSLGPRIADPGRLRFQAMRRFRGQVVLLCSAFRPDLPVQTAARRAGKGEAGHGAFSVLTDRRIAVPGARDSDLALDVMSEGCTEKPEALQELFRCPERLDRARLTPGRPSFPRVFRISTFFTFFPLPLLRRPRRTIYLALRNQ